MSPDGTGPLTPPIALSFPGPSRERPPSNWAGDLRGVQDEQWLVKGMVPSEAYVGIFGRRGSAKSFFGLEMAMRGALAQPFLGQATRGFGSLYCVGEKQKAFSKRVAAWLRVNDPDEAMPPGVVIRWGVPDLLDPASVIDFIAEIEERKPDFEAAGAPLKAVFLDTLSRAIRGASVSDLAVAGPALEAIQQIKKQTGVTVLPLAHVAKAQGAETLKGAGEWEDMADALIRIDRKDGSNRRTVTLSKQSDEIDGAKWAFELKRIDLGLNSDGDPITSCVMVTLDCDPLDPDVKLSRGPKLGSAGEMIRAALNRMLDDGRAKQVPAFPGVRGCQKGAMIADLREASYALGLHHRHFEDESDEPGQAKAKEKWREVRRKTFKRGLERMHELNVVRQEGGWVWFR
ncbi:MAG: hypothetical protein JWP35_1450 [Caulobacter sp.]|nr:hypothetical protein [Caulobacter sp.]